MEAFLSILSQPITQVGGIIGIASLLHKAGIVDMRKFLQKVVASLASESTREINADTRDALQTTLSKLQQDMLRLSNYYNHDTTKLLNDLVEETRRTNELLRENFAEIHAKHSEWDRRGIPTEDCRNRK